MAKEKNKEKEPPRLKTVGRRDVIKGLATIPFMGAFAAAWLRKSSVEHQLKNNLLEMVNLTAEPVELASSSGNAKTLRLGIIGYGIRGRHLLRATGFAEPKWIDDAMAANAENRLNTSYEDFIKQENLNVIIAGVCDVFDLCRGCCTCRFKCQPRRCERKDGNGAQKIPYVQGIDCLTRYRCCHHRNP
jgi:hypothetical protein